MKNFAFCIAFLIVFSLSLTAQTSKQETAVRKVMDDQVAAWNRGDLEGFMDGYWRSEKLTFTSGDEVTRGWQQALDNYRKSYNTKEKMGVLSFSVHELTILSKDSAVVLGSWSLKREKDNPHGKFTVVFRKLKEGWRIVMDHTS